MIVLRRSVAGFSPRTAELYPSVGFASPRKALGHVSPSTHSSPVSIIPPILRYLSFVSHRRYKISPPFSLSLPPLPQSHPLSHSNTHTHTHTHKAEPITTRIFIMYKFQFITRNVKYFQASISLRQN